MKNRTFNFEVKDLLTQFVAAFDDIIIKRYDKDRVAQSLLQVRYVYAPKQRVMYDLVNKAQNITVPVVSVSISNIARDETRVFNKLGGFYFPSSNILDNKSNFLASPVPINITVNMSIMTKFQSDMDQIISNFVPYNNPYIIISWKIPSNLLEDTQEIRSEILWSGSVNVSYPTDINASEKYKIVGDTSFTIKGWMFQVKQGDVGNIFQIDSNFSAERSVPLYDDVMQMASLFTAPSSLVVQQTEKVSVSGSPLITDVVYSISPLDTAG